MDSTTAVVLPAEQAACSVRSMLAAEDIGLGEAVVLLDRVDPSTLDGSARVDLVELYERAVAMLQGRQQAALAAVVDATTSLGLEGDLARHEIGAALRLAPVTAAERTMVARELTGRLSATLALMNRGRVSWAQGRVLADGVRDLPDELAAAVQARVLPKLGELTVAETRRLVQAAVVAVDPGSAAERHQRARKARTIEAMPGADGMTSWFAAMPADTERELWAALTARAKAIKAARRVAGLDREPLAALRVDALAELVLGPTADRARCAPDCSSPDSWQAAPGPGPDSPLEGGEGPSDPAAAERVRALLGEPGLDALDPGVRARLDAVLADALAGALAGAAGPAGPVGLAGRRVPRCSCGGRAQAAVVLDLPTALGLAEHPGHLPGYGAIPAGMARAMAADRDWVRWTTDPGTGLVLDRGAHTYRPSARLAAFITARDPVCGFPGCNQPAVRCDLDHATGFDHGGPTTRCNLGPLCRAHHNAKTHTRWTLSYQPATGTRVWTSPLGKTYLKTSIPRLLWAPRR